MWVAQNSQWLLLSACEWPYAAHILNLRLAGWHQCQGTSGACEETLGLELSSNGLKSLEEDLVVEKWLDAGGMGGVLPNPKPGG